MTKSIEKQFPKSQSLEKFSQNTENISSHYSSRIYFVFFFPQDIAIIKCGRLSLLDTALYNCDVGWNSTFQHVSKQKKRTESYLVALAV